MIPFEVATWKQVQACAKYAGLDDRIDIWKMSNRPWVIKTLRAAGYVGVNATDPDWVIPVRK